jgi:histidine ammonia-lyase
MASGDRTITLTGNSLTIGELEAASRGCGRIALAEPALQRMAGTRRIIEAAIRDRVPIYGVTTGLGTRVTEALGEKELTEFSVLTLRGRAQAMGEPLSSDVVRAAMVVRANTLLTGASGASPALACHLASVVNAGLTPVVGGIGSIGASDLLLGAVLGCALLGEGQMRDAAGRIASAGDALSKAGLSPLQAAPRDGLALCGHDAFSAATVALGLARASRVLQALQGAAAVSLEAFRANLSPLREEVLALRPQPGEAEIARHLRALLAGSALEDPGEARRLQDPLSLRNIAQVHAAVLRNLRTSSEIATLEINGATDNPAVLAASGEVVSTGNYHNPQLTLAAEQSARALLLAATLEVARIAKLLSSRFTDLPMYLAVPGAHSNGFAPHLKLAESLLARIQSAASPVAIWPSLCSDGVEDALTNSLEAGQKLMAAAGDCCLLAALELAIAAEAAGQRKLGERKAPAIARAIELVRAHVGPLGADRPLHAELRSLAAAIDRGELTDALGVAAVS